MDRRIDYVRCLVSCFVEMISILQCLKCWKWAIPFNNRTPPIEDTCFRLMTPEGNSMPWNVYPWGIPCHKMSTGTAEEFHAIKCLHLRNSMRWNVYRYPWGIPCHEMYPMLIVLYPWGIPWGFPSSFDPVPRRNSKLILLYPWGIPC